MFKIRLLVALADTEYRHIGKLVNFNNVPVL